MHLTSEIFYVVLVKVEKSRGYDYVELCIWGYRVTSGNAVVKCNVLTCTTSKLDTQTHDSLKVLNIHNQE